MDMYTTRTGNPKVERKRKRKRKGKGKKIKKKKKEKKQEQKQELEQDKDKSHAHGEEVHCCKLYRGNLVSSSLLLPYLLPRCLICYVYPPCLIPYSHSPLDPIHSDSTPPHHLPPSSPMADGKIFILPFDIDPRRNHIIHINTNRTGPALVTDLGITGITRH